jgi:hypothetical protein
MNEIEMAIQVLRETDLKKTQHIIKELLTIRSNPQPPRYMEKWVKEQSWIHQSGDIYKENSQK